MIGSTHDSIQIVRPALTLDTSCVISILPTELVYPPDGATREEREALHVLVNLAEIRQISLWSSESALKESRERFEQFADTPSKAKWRGAIDTLQSLPQIWPGWYLGVSGYSELGVATWVSENDPEPMASRLNELLENCEGKPPRAGEIIDMEIIADHYRAGFDLFVIREKRFLNDCVRQPILAEFKLRIVSPIEAISTLSDDFQIKV